MRKSDRDALAALLLVIVVAVVLFPLLGDRDVKDKEYRKENPHGTRGHKGSPSSYTKGTGAGYYAQPDQGYGDGSTAYNGDGLASRLFPFDPNTADSTTLLRLGLKPWQVRNIYKYRASGGRYRQATDFARLYGLTARQYRRLEPYIVIEREPMAADVIRPAARPARSPYNDGATYPNGDAVSRSKSVVSHSSNGSYPHKLTPGSTVDINTADTTLLQRIPGIGPYYARRIVELRQRRQMFTSPEELLAIRNFPETALIYMTVSTNFPSIRVNSMTQKELAAHPLLNHTQALDIATLRRTGGTINTIADLEFLPSFTAEHLKRITPYIVFE